jgi:hypothetical protein
MQCTWGSTYMLSVEKEALSAFSTRCTWVSTYTLLVEEGKEALSAFSVRCTWGSTYKLSVEEGRKHLSAFNAWIRQHPPVTIPLPSIGDIPSDSVKFSPNQAPFQSLPLYPNLNGLFGPQYTVLTHTICLFRILAQQQFYHLLVLLYHSDMKCSAKWP